MEVSSIYVHCPAYEVEDEPQPEEPEDREEHAHDHSLKNCS